jgi:glucose/arabinose dehydrogenase
MTSRFTRLIGWATAVVGLLMGLPLTGQVTLPDNFVLERVDPSLIKVVGMHFDKAGRGYLWQKKGKVWLLEDGEVRPEPLIDISDEVGDWRDHGLLGFALDPNFANNGYFYLLYVVDRYALFHREAPGYRPDSNDYYSATIGRITRYTADPSTDFTRVVPGSREVILGATPSTGIPILHESHGVGSLAMGTDGTLMVSVGDAASYLGWDIGGEEKGAYINQAIADGILRPKEDVGAWRSQLVDCYNGKILRIDPRTGLGVPSNPFYDAEAPDAPRSKVWALGLRNPFRCNLVGEGSHNPTDANPGTLFLGDVGYMQWEEINVVDQPGLNFGWPEYEGIEYFGWGYPRFPRPNLDAPNPVAGCEQAHFNFQDLLVQARADEQYQFATPCQPSLQVSEDIPHFVHTPPVLEWANALKDTISARVPYYPPDGGEVSPVELVDERSSVQGENFWGSSVTAGVFYDGNSFPETYHQNYFFADHSAHWIKMLEVDSSLRPVAVHDFAASPFPIADIKVHPISGDLYFTAFPGEVWRIAYGGNVKPQARIDVDQHYGASPLTVSFSAEASTDQNNDPLSYHWDFGDGSSSQAMTPSHTFTATGDQPEAFTVTLTVTDTAGARSQQRQVVSLNNTPPSIRIVSPDRDFQYSTQVPMTLPLRAEVSDAEHEGEEDFFYRWQVILHHNNHVHPEEIDPSVESEAVLAPIGCGDEVYYFRILLEVEDAAGLRSRDEVILWPDCTPATEWGPLVAEVQPERVVLNWDNRFEVNTQYFEVERSQDGGQHFTVIGTFPAAGNSSSPTRYQYIDEEPYEGPAVYRVKLREEGIKYEYSDTAQVEWKLYGKVALYPNPTEGPLTAQINDIAGEAELVITDHLGRVLLHQVWSETQTGRHRLRLDGLPTGLYHYRFSNGINTETGTLQVKQ